MRSRMQGKTYWRSMKPTTGNEVVPVGVIRTLSRHPSHVTVKRKTAIAVVLRNANRIPLNWECSQETNQILFFDSIQVIRLFIHKRFYRASRNASMNLCESMWRSMYSILPQRNRQVICSKEHKQRELSNRIHVLYGRIPDAASVTVGQVLMWG